MKLPCSVVRDLLPVYAEDLTEPETNALVQAHLEECADCRTKAEALKGDAARPVDTAQPLHRLKRQIRRRRWRTAAISALCVFLVFFVYVCRADSMVPLQWQDGLIEVQGVENVGPEDRTGRGYHQLSEFTRDQPHEYTGEALILRMDSRIVGVNSTTVIAEDGTETVYLQGMGRSSQKPQTGLEEYGEMVLYPVPQRVMYGYGNVQQLLWGEPMNGGAQVLPRLALAYYLLIAAALACVLGLAWLLVRKRRCAKCIRQLFLLPCAYLLAHLLIKGTTTVTFFFMADFLCILLTAAALYALVTLGWQAWGQRGGV